MFNVVALLPPSVLVYSNLLLEIITLFKHKKTVLPSSSRFLNFPFKSTNARTFQKKGAKKSRARNETKKQTPCIPGIGSRQEATPKDVILLLHTYTTTLLPTRIF